MFRPWYNFFGTPENWSISSSVFVPHAMVLVSPFFSPCSIFWTTPSITPIHEHLSVEPTQSVLRSEYTPLCSEYKGPARADPDEVSETPALVVSGRTSNDTNPQETELPSAEVSLVPLATDEPFFCHVDN